MPVGNMPVFNVDNGFVQIFFRQIMDDDLTGISKLNSKAVRKLL